MKRIADTIPTPLFQAFDTASDNSLFIYYCICVHFVCLSSHLYRSILLLLVVVVACASGPRGVFVRVLILVLVFVLAMLAIMCPRLILKKILLDAPPFDLGPTGLWMPAGSSNL